MYKNVLIKSIFWTVSSAILSIIVRFFYDHEIVGYVWAFAVFWVCAVNLFKFLLELYYRKKFNEAMLMPAIVIVAFAVYFEAGERMIIIGFGIGLIYTLVLLLSSYYPMLVSRNKTIKEKSGKKKE